MTNIIQIRRGLNANLPTLRPGELGFSTDTHQLHIGDGTNNHEVMMRLPFNIEVNTETKVVDSFVDTLGDGAVWFYVVKKDTSLRSGIIIAAWDLVSGSTPTFHDGSATEDLGDTSDVSFLVDKDGNTVRLRSAAESNDWLISVQRLALCKCS